MKLAVRGESTAGLFEAVPLYRTLRHEVAPLLRTWPSVKVWHAGASAAQQFANELAVYERLNAAGCSGVLRMVAHSAQGEAPQWIALDGIGVAVRDLLVEALGADSGARIRR